VVALERIDNFVRRAGDVVGVIAEHVPQEFSAAMNDDLGTPAAVAVLHNVVREGNQALEAGETDLVATRLAEVLGMLAILGLDADSAAWERRVDQQLTAVVEGLVTELLKHREAARERKDFGAADAIRDSLAALGVEVLDTQQGPRWRVR
jgi:cysteinyl-tRNA synthetase